MVVADHLGFLAVVYHANTVIVPLPRCQERVAKKPHRRPAACPIFCSEEKDQWHGIAFGV